MKRIIIAALLTLPLPALAQGADNSQALGQEIMECTGTKVQLRTRIIALEAELAKVKAPPPPKEEPKN